MTTEQFDQISTLIQQDPAWMAKFAAAGSKQAWLDLAVEAAQSHGVETNAADVEAYLQGRFKADGDRELSLTELSSISGGSDGYVDSNY